MGKTQSTSLGKGKWVLKFLISFVFLFLSFGTEAEAIPIPNSPKDLSPFFFLTKSDSSLVLGIFTEAKKERLPSYGTKLALPILPKNPRHLWKGSFLYENQRFSENENRAFHRFFSGLEYSYLHPEKRIRISWLAGWERGEINLFVFGIHLEISEKQGIQILGKSGGDFRNVSILLHSPLEKELKLFLGASRAWNETITEDRFFVGIGFSWENLQTSTFGSKNGHEEHSVSSIFEFQNILNTEDFSKEKLVPKILPPKKRIPSFSKFSLGVQELLSSGFSLNSSLRISGESSRSREEFFEFLDSLSEKEKNRIFVLLKKKNSNQKKEKR
ncbi:hypothetical protein JWG45_04380 [Leptospira sp. 201903070]|uniref:Inverse autotransporter beta-domain domain-containing protein n=1 Tax=Leptospira ainlahdjerensis TaxID=2810033 RepID=A0ABS2U7N6_9LEPT|nr:hypothetical protein [Leptospira ainlahdjerensis]MBM9576386.1 hypothetical protein [Leptospira ainlahdjerensis]